MLYEILTLVFSALAVAAAFITFLYSRHRNVSSDTEKHIQELVKGATDKLREDFSAEKFTSADVRSRLDRIERITEKTVPRLDVLEAKIDVFWRNVAYDAARILHSPHPDRAELDTLLEAFQENKLDPSGMEKLVRKLEEVKQNRNGKFLNGDRMAAIVLLNVIDQFEATDAA